MLVTAAHCLYDNALTGGNTGYYAPGTLEWTPGSTWNGNADVPPELVTAAAQTVSAPYGVWPVANAWVPQCWADHNGQCDVGFVELAPAQDGTYVGDTLGSWGLVVNVTTAPGARFISMGYSASGIFQLGENGYGNAQYLCDINWQGELYNMAALSGNANNMSSNDPAAPETDDCVMTGGASGGPIFVGLSDGSWAVNGVNSGGAGTGLIGRNMTWNYASDTYAQLWQSIVGTGAQNKNGSGGHFAGHRGLASPAARDDDYALKP